MLESPGGGVVHGEAPSGRGTDPAGAQCEIPFQRCGHVCSSPVGALQRSIRSAGSHGDSRPTGAPSRMHDTHSSPDAERGIARSPARYCRMVRSATPAS